MGMNERSGGGGGNMVFLNPINTEGGVRWARRVTKDTEGSTEREAKCGLVHELYYESVDGMIKSVRIVDKGQYGEELEIALEDDGLTMLLQTPFSGDIGKGFICRMCNINPDDLIEIGVWTKGERRYLYAKQGGEKIANPYARGDKEESEKSLPAPVEKKAKRGNKSEWDWEDHDQALYEVCRDISVENGWAQDEEDFTLSAFKHAGSDQVPADTADQALPPDDDGDVPF